MGYPKMRGGMGEMEFGEPEGAPEVRGPSRLEVKGKPRRGRDAEIGRP